MTPQELIDRWRQVRAGLITTVGKFSEDELDYVAVQGGYSVATLVLHIAHED